MKSTRTCFGSQTRLPDLQSALTDFIACLAGEVGNRRGTVSLSQASGRDAWSPSAVATRHKNFLPVAVVPR